jgi:integrase
LLKNKNGLKFDIRKVGKYYCKNKDNMIYFDKLINFFEHEGSHLSFINRITKINYLKVLTSLTKIELSEIESGDNRAEINKIVSKARNDIYSDDTMTYFIGDLKWLWKIFFPVKDGKGRINERETPYVVRHLSQKSDKSKQKAKKDRMTIDEYKKIINTLSDDTRIQFFCSLIYDSFGRPQELLYRKISDVQVFDNYAKIIISDHGKEGVGLLRCVDSFPYLLKHLENHPQKDNKNAWLFPVINGVNKFNQMSVASVNKKLRIVCKALNIDKPITAYSFKRNGISDARLNPKINDKQIQDRARWTTSKQLHTYDICGQEESFRSELIQRGLLKPETEADVGIAPTTKQCPFCNSINPIADKICFKCKRLLYREDIEAEELQKQKENKDLQEQMRLLQKEMDSIKAGVIKTEVSKRNEELLKSLVKKNNEKMLKRLLSRIEKLEKIY